MEDVETDDLRQSEEQTHGTQDQSPAPTAPATGVNGPSPLLTPIHPTPEVNATNTSNITPGQGTPSVTPTTERVESALNPTYQADDGRTFTYEDCDEELNKQLQNAYNACREHFLRKYKVNELTPELHEQAKKDALQLASLRWKTSMPKELFEPFMDEREQRLQAIREQRK